MNKKVKVKKPLVFEWDTGNNDKNIHKHKVENSESEEVFVNYRILLIDITHLQAENRYLAYGVTDNKRQLVIVFTLRGKYEERIRIISSRDQDKKESELYKKLKSEMKRKK